MSYKTRLLSKKCPTAFAYVAQGSIYKFLNPDIITKDEMLIHYIFTDWQKIESLKKEDYPSSRVYSQKIPLLSEEETYSFIEAKLKLLEQYRNANEKDIPYCTDEELWRKPTVWKYYKNANATRATKNFDNPSEAYALQQTNGVGEVREVKGTVSACKYCPAFLLCSQKDRLIQTGDLVL